MLRRGFLKVLFGGLCAAPVAAKAVEPKEEKKNLLPTDDFSVSCWISGPNRIYGNVVTTNNWHHVTCVHDPRTATISFKRN